MYEPSTQPLIGPPPAVGQTSSERTRRPGRPIDPHRLLHLLRRRRPWLVLVVLVGLGLGYAVPAWLMPRAYEATTSLVYEGVAEVEGIPGPGPFELGTLIDSVELPANLQRVREIRGYDVPLRQLGAAIEVEVSSHSNVINVTATEQSAEDAAALANTAVEVFLDHRVQVERQRLEEQLASVEQDLARATRRLGEVRADYDAFRREHRIADLNIEQQHAIEQAAAFRAQADLARADAEAERARLRELQARSRRATPVVRGPEHAALERSQAELAAAQSRYSGEHPRVIALQRQVAVLEQQAAASSRRAAAGMLGPMASAASQQAAEERQGALREMAHEARRRIDELSEIEGQASSLLAAVRVAEAHVDRLEAKRARVEDASLGATSGFRVVSPAIPPEVPSGSKARWLAAAGIPTGLLLLALVGFLGLELRGLRLQTANEIAYWGRGAVIGTTSWPRDSSELEALVAELDDIAPDAAGSTLVVAATPDAQPLAAELAERLNDDWCPESLIDLSEYSIDVSQSLETPAPAAGGSALVRREPTALAIPSELGWESATRAWKGPTAGPQLRRAARLADRVLVVVRSGSLGALELAKLRVRLGREEGIGFVVVDAPEDLADAADRAGDVASFWLERNE